MIGPGGLFLCYGLGEIQMDRGWKFGANLLP
jgi:hypothetical protein